MTKIRFSIGAGLAGLVLLSGLGHARVVRDRRSHHRPRPQLPAAAFTGLTTNSPLAATITGSNVWALADGALLLDADSGQLVRVDANEKPLAHVNVGADAAQMVVFERTVFVADRAHDRVVTYALGEPGQATLTQTGQFATRAEPYGLALAPGRKLLLVTSVADQDLSAYTLEGKRLWSLRVGPEPRGVAVSPDERTALVTFLTQGSVARIELRAQPELSYVTLQAKPMLPVPMGNRFGGIVGNEIDSMNPIAEPAQLELPQQQAVRAPGEAPEVVAEIEGSLLSDKGRTFPRNAFAVMFASNDLAIVPHQMSTPHTPVQFEASGTYGGGGSFQSPVAHQMAFIARRGARAQVTATPINLHQPRALAVDVKRNLLYVAGYGSDEIQAFSGVSGSALRLKWRHVISDKSGACGPNGLAVRDDGQLLVSCSLSRRITRLSERPQAVGAYQVTSEELTASRLSPSQQRGQALFRSGNNPAMSGGGALACASCHAEGRSDGLSWRIEKKNLQTPFLAGRLVGTHPFKWDGADKDLPTSLKHTVVRLGGTGLSAEQAKDLAAYLTSLDRPRTPTPRSTAAVARGKSLFFSEATGCSSCHMGSKTTNRRKYDFADDLEKVDTPSLIGLAHSAPYYHDGSAANLHAVLLEKGNVHGMGKLTELSEPQVDDLVAYLETL